MRCVDACVGRGEAWRWTRPHKRRHRATPIAQLPPDAAKVLFGRIGFHEHGCLSGAIALPADGPNGQVMRPSRNRAWGHPA